MAKDLLLERGMPIDTFFSQDLEDYLLTLNSKEIQRLQFIDEL